MTMFILLFRSTTEVTLPEPRILLKVTYASNGASWRFHYLTRGHQTSPEVELIFLIYDVLCGKQQIRDV